jgi:peptide-methionine (S)-S-oxide reductase
MRKLIAMTLSLWVGLLCHNSATAEARSATAIFAGGCFWCMEADFEGVDGVTEVTSGYTGGHLTNPTYGDVTRGSSGHYEAVEVIYDPSEISYAELLSVFWMNIDPLDGKGQFCDKGSSYRSAIFPLNDTQHEAATSSRAEAQKTLGKNAEIVTPILAASTFYPAEEYHQNYYLNNSLRYKYYRWNCGRDARLEAVWGKDALGGDQE